MKSVKSANRRLKLTSIEIVLTIIKVMMFLFFFRKTELISELKLFILKFPC